MPFRRRVAGLVVACAVIASVRAATAQAPPSPSPSPPARADENAAIVKPLVEIGRVHARSPYCGALARARVGIDSAITFEYSTSILANDLQDFRLDSLLTKHQSLKKTERDLTGLWNLAVAGRDDVRALRAAAAAEPDEEKRKEMLAFADALDGAKARQMQLSKAMARFVGALAEQPVHDIVHNEAGDRTGDALAWKALGRSPQIDEDAPPAAHPVAAPPDPRVALINDQQATQRLFGAFAVEKLIRDDLKQAAQHGTKAMQLGNCQGI